jgi:hypothetical protein
MLHNTYQVENNSQQQNDKTPSTECQRKFAKLSMTSAARINLNEKYVQTRINPGSPTSSKNCVNKKVKPQIEELVLPTPVESCGESRSSTGRGGRLTEPA